LVMPLALISEALAILVLVTMNPPVLISDFLKF
jgi:hypothetical protein